MESIIEYIKSTEEENEAVSIEKLRICLDNGGDIDFIFEKDLIFEMTILHHFIMEHSVLGVEYALRRGANVSINVVWMGLGFTDCNALELAADVFNEYDDEPRNAIFDMVKYRSLKLYSKHGLTPLHVDSAVCMEYWFTELEEYLQTIDVNATISTESPFWPGMTPMSIAAKWYRLDLVKRLLDLGANPIVRDTEGNTVLHFFSKTNFCDKRLFTSDNGNTFSSQTGESHFHIACGKCPEALDVVKRYLDQGVSPDLQIKKTDSEKYYNAGKTGLHLAVEKNCPELIRLLVEYGADVDKEDVKGKTPVEFLDYWECSYIPEDTLKIIECTSLLIESGSNMERIAQTNLNYSTNAFYKDSTVGLAFLRCIVRLTTLKKDIVPKQLMHVYRKTVAKCEWWDEIEYVGRCSGELETLAGVGLRNALDFNAAVEPDYEIKFGSLGSSDFEAYPIYGKLLETMTKRKLLEFKDKKGRIRPAIPKLQWLFQSKCFFPHFCAEMILWNFSNEEIDQFVAQK